MKYTTVNELENFRFSEAYISAIQKINGCFQVTLDNVKITPDNSYNRDVREMRTNGLNLKIKNGKVSLLIEEGYTLYNADGQLIEQHEDCQIEEKKYNDVLKTLASGDSCIYTLEKKEDTYIFEIDAGNERTYALHVTGTGDIEEWNRFLNL